MSTIVLDYKQNYVGTALYGVTITGMYMYCTKRKTYTQCLFNVAPASYTVDQQ